MTYSDAEVVHHYRPVGSARELFLCKDREVLLSGMAGTGKTMGCLEKVHTLCLKYPGTKALLVRKTQESLTKAAMVTYQEEVAKEAIANGEVRYYGGSTKEPASFKYAEGSTIVTGGMDKADKVLSSAYDIIYVQEATELTEDDWTTLLTRLRNNKIPHMQIIADCNPSHPQHWLKQRCDSGKTTMIYCSHKDNPILWDEAAGEWTELGKEYVLGTLDSLTGLQRDRFLLGKWSAAHGLVYEEFDDKVHLFDRKTPFGSEHNSGKRDYTWYWSVDFGFTNPFVCQMWAVDSDGRMYLFREIYMTGKTVEEHAKTMKQMMKVAGHKIPWPKAIVCDTADPEAMAVLRKELGSSNVVPAKKSVNEGIDLVKTRLKVQADGKPRIYFNRSALYQEDRKLAAQKKPLRTTDELLGYVWNPNKEAPVKENDHGMDAMRYMVAHLDMRKVPRIRYIDY